jgi:nitrate/nitrite transport system substrate-binding protein
MSEDGIVKRVSSEENFAEAVEESFVNSVLKAAHPSRRQFLNQLGTATLIALIGEVFPLSNLKAFAAGSLGTPEKKDLTIGFIPITCAVPIIMAEPMGFYHKYGLNVSVKKAPGWAVIRDWAVNKEVDAAHMLCPMPLATTMGVGSVASPFIMPALENVNGQAITLHIKHKNIQSVAEMKGFKFCIPFPFSIHNYLLRFVLSEAGLDPDKDVQIRVVPPPEMVANLRAGNVDGYIAPDPTNQRAVYENIGFIYKLSKDIWDRHPCCAIGVHKEFATTYPNTFDSLLRSIVDAAHYASPPDHRKEIASAIAPANYLNQPVTILEQVLTGTYADGLGNIKKAPDRIDFAPFPERWMAIWILTQMKRWGQVKGDLDYNAIADQVFQEATCNRIFKEMGYVVHERNNAKHKIMGKVFDPRHPEAYVDSFKFSTHS